MSSHDAEFAAFVLSLRAGALKAATPIAGNAEGRVAVPLAASDARALGAALEAIAEGADPYDALGIARPGRGAPRRAALWLVVAYMRHRAAGMSRKEARDALVREHGERVPTVDTFVKWYSARRADEREALWEVVEGRTYRRDERGALVIERSGPDATALREEIEKDAHRGSDGPREEVIG